MSFGLKFILVRQVTAENGSSEDHRFWHLKQHRNLQIGCPIFFVRELFEVDFLGDERSYRHIFFYSVDMIHADVMIGFIWIGVQQRRLTNESKTLDIIVF